MQINRSDQGSSLPWLLFARVEAKYFGGAAHLLRV